MRAVIFSVLFLGLFFAQPLAAQELNIGIWKDGRKTVKAYYHSDEIVVWIVDGKREITVPQGRTTYFTARGNGKVKLSSAKTSFGEFSSIKLLKGAETFILKSLDPIRTEERYNHEIQVSNVDGSLHIVNHISSLDDYVAGVVEAESGKEQNEEYYKAQAVICRTYALSNIRKHEAEGYNLCDQVHCQVYHGIARHEAKIIAASTTTSGQVVVDSDLNLITAAFHSNCGGETVNSEDVWSKAVPYLRAKRDTFCLHRSHAQWESTILKSAWNEYLHTESPHLISDGHADLYAFRPNQRETLYPTSDAGGLELKKLRHKWRLKSTYFEIEDVEDRLVLKGRGFGHGVGLCQEGAMSMSRQSYTYQEILQFYYTDVHILHLSVLDFFREN